MSWIARVSGYAGKFPVLDTSLLVTCVTGMLGIGAMRSFEKVNSVDTKAIVTATKAAPTVATQTKPTAVKEKRRWKKI